MFGQQPPLVRVDQSALWYGAGAFGSLFGGQNIARNAATGGESYKYTIIPLPVVPTPDVTLQRLADAVATSVTGRLEEMVDVYRLSVERDGWMDSILRTMAHGLLGMPLSFQGDPEMCSALLDADGTAGDFFAMHPEGECSKIFSDFIGLGFGLGQYLLMCWRCQGVEWARISGETVAHLDHEVCLRCGADRAQRPYGARELFGLRWRDPRWLWRNPITGQCYYNGRQGMVPFTPGDGEWLLVTSVPDQDMWRNGPWTWGCVAAIMARDARFDAANTSAVCAPMHVFQAQGPTAQQTRAQVDQEAKGIRFGNSVTLPGEWKHEIHAAKAEFMDVCGKILDDSTGMWEVGITGNNHGMKAGPGLANMDVYDRVTERRRAFYAGAWIRQVTAQGLVWWARANYGPTARCPVGSYDVKSPADKLKIVEALGAMGDGVMALINGLKVAGVRPTAAQVIEICQRGGVRVEAIPGDANTSKLALGVEAVMACVRGGVALDSLGVERFPSGDPRNEMTLTELANLGKTPGAPAPPTPPAPAGVAPAPVEAPPAARLEGGECDPEEDDCDDAARLAQDMNDLGASACRHRITTSCARCGVKASYRATKSEDGAVVYRATWRPLKTRPAQVAA